MADKEPTAPTKYIDDNEFLPRKPILASTHKEIMNDQLYALNLGRPIIMDCHYPMEYSDPGAGSFTELARYFVDGPDRCGAYNLSTEAVEACFYCWADAGQNWEIQVRNTVTGLSALQNVTTAVTSKIWRGYASRTGFIQRDTTENELIVEIKQTSGSGNIYYAGFAVFAATLAVGPETPI